MRLVASDGVGDAGEACSFQSRRLFPGHADDRPLLGRIDPHQHRRRAVDPRDDLLVDERIAALRNVAERHGGAVETREERDVLELLAETPFGNGMQDESAASTRSSPSEG